MHPNVTEKRSKHSLLLFFQDDEEMAEYALDGLKQVMAVKSRSVLPYLVPKVKHQNRFLHLES